MIDVHFVPVDQEHPHDLHPGCWCEPRQSLGTFRDRPARLIDHRSDSVAPFDVILPDTEPDPH